LNKVAILLTTLFIISCTTAPEPVINSEIFLPSKYSKVICNPNGFLVCLDITARQCKGINLLASSSCKIKTIEITKDIKDINDREKASSREYSKCLLTAQVNISNQLGNTVNYQCMNEIIKSDK